MLLHNNNLTIRDASVRDASLLASWWNDGAIMAHAGFPNGIGTTEEAVAEKIKKDSDEDRRLIIELDGTPIGEMCYRNVGEGTAEIGIKICDRTKQEKGHGKILLSMLIFSLFQDMGYQKVVLDTDISNKRAQHVYEELGFRKLRVNRDSWRDQLGQLRSSVDYEIYPADLNNFARRGVKL